MIRPNLQLPILRYWIRKLDQDWLHRGTTGRRSLPRAVRNTRRRDCQKRIDGSDYRRGDGAIWKMSVMKGRAWLWLIWCLLAFGAMNVYGPNLETFRKPEDPQTISRQDLRA